MKPPTTVAPFVMIGLDGKEYAAQDKQTLGQWWGQGAINESSKIWSAADQKWGSPRDFDVRRVRRIPVTTGDLKREYRIIDVVFGYVAKDKPAFGFYDIPAGYSEVTDQLANAAAALGANAVVWARYEHIYGGVMAGFAFIGSGTAVAFTTAT